MEENKNRCVRGSHAYTRFIAIPGFVLAIKKVTNTNRLSGRKNNERISIDIGGEELIIL
jgi:hypothetical protein